jgi:FkbM family methyltransferase
MSVRSIVKQSVFQAITLMFGDKDKFVTMPILSGPGKGLLIKGDLIARQEVYFLGWYERDVFDAIIPYVCEGSTIWDCGTHIGYYTIIFAKMVGPTGAVLAIDLDSDNMRRTMDNVALNHFANVVYANVAIGAATGQVEFIKDERTNSHIPGTYVGGREMQKIWNDRDKGMKRGVVESISIDQAVREKRFAKPDLIKLDIDGAEKYVLENEAHIFTDVRPIVLVELHNPDCDRSAWEFSRKFEYQLISVATRKIITEASQVGGAVICRPL